MALVLDGNMKNHRDVCMAKDAGYIEFDGILGSVKTGCQASPNYKSRFCAKHTPHACDLTKPIDDEELSQFATDEAVGPCLRSTKSQLKKVMK